MYTVTKFIVPPLAVLTMTVSLTSLGWTRDSIVHVSLWDKGADAGLARGPGMGMAGADMSKAIMGLKLSTNLVEAGRVTLEVTNNSKDNIHEMVVLPVRGDGEKLPYNAADNAVDEHGIGDLGEVSELEPGGSGTLTLDLKPGKYALFCNVPGHYTSGMWTLLTVR